jgi:RNA polymerase sigma-70 factor (ECF subfamily)
VQEAVFLFISICFFGAMETDQTLLNAARMMDKEALVQIFDLYASALYKYAVRLCGDPVLADHIVGDVFAKLLEQLAAGNGPKANLRSYLYESTYHRVIDETRYSKRRVSLDMIPWLQQDANSISTNGEEQIMVQQVLHAVRSKLTEDQRQVIILRFLEEFSILETAAILGKKADHVRVLQSRAIAALRRFFEYQGIRKVAPSSGQRGISKAPGD